MTKLNKDVEKEFDKLQEELVDKVNQYFPKVKPEGGNKGRGEAMVIMALALAGAKNIMLKILFKELQRQKEEIIEIVWGEMPQRGDSITMVNHLNQAFRKLNQPKESK